MALPDERYCTWQLSAKPLWIKVVMIYILKLLFCTLIQPETEIVPMVTQFLTSSSLSELALNELLFV